MAQGGPIISATRMSVGAGVASPEAEKALVTWRGYLGEAARRAIRNPGTVTLPRDLKYPRQMR